MNPEQQIKKLEEEIQNLKKDFSQHRHTGADSQKVAFVSLGEILMVEATFDPSSLADGSGETLQETVQGANLGNIVLVTAPYDLQGVNVTAYVQSQDTIEIRLQNESGSVVDLDSGVWKIYIIKT